MKYLKYFEQTSAYEAYKNGSDFILPNVSYAKDNNTVYYNPFEEAKSGVIMAHYNATEDNMLAIANTSNVKSLKVNGETVFSGQITNKTTEVIGSNIVVNEDGTAEFPDEYLYSSQDGVPVKMTVKLKDNSDISSDYYILACAITDSEKRIDTIPINEAVNLGLIKVINNTIIASTDFFTGVDSVFFVLSSINEETGDSILFDTINEIEFMSGIPSSYYFDEVGEYDAEIELYDVTSIGYDMFTECSSLTSVIIPDSVTSIGWHAFSYCSSLTSVIIPDSVTSIGNVAFQKCTSLTSIVIPDSVTSIGTWVFCNCLGLTSITIPNSVTSIKDYAFAGCINLTSIVIPDSVTSIGSYAFRGCSGLTSIIIPDSVTSIGEDVFSRCTSLTSINIPASVTSIGNYAFEGCSILNEITCNAIIAPTINSNTFQNVASNGILKVPTGSDYSSWMSIDKYYLGYYGWNIEYILPEDAKVFEICDAIIDQEQNSNDTEELFDIVYAKLGEDAIKENKFNTPISVKEATGYDYIVLRAGSNSAEYIDTIKYIDYNAYEDGGYNITIRHSGGNDASVKSYYDNTLTYYTDNIPV